MQMKWDFSVCQAGWQSRNRHQWSPFLLARRGKKPHRNTEILTILSATEKNDPIETDAKPTPLRIYSSHKRQIYSFKYLNTSVGAFSIYHPLAHLTAFGTPCCKLMTLGFLTPDPHLNRNQPRVQRRKHPTSGGLGQFPSPSLGNFISWMSFAERQREKVGLFCVQTLVKASAMVLQATAECRSPLQKVSIFTSYALSYS